LFFSFQKGVGNINESVKGPSSATVSSSAKSPTARKSFAAKEGVADLLRAAAFLSQQGAAKEPSRVEKSTDAGETSALKNQQGAADVQGQVDKPTDAGETSPLRNVGEKVVAAADGSSSLLPPTLRHLVSFWEDVSTVTLRIVDQNLIQPSPVCVVPTASKDVDVKKDFKVRYLVFFFVISSQYRSLFLSFFC